MAVNKQKRDATRAIIKSLEHDIIFGRLHPRERLIEDELMERFSAKRHTIRTALDDRFGEG